VKSGAGTPVKNASTAGGSAAKSAAKATPAKNSGPSVAAKKAVTAQGAPSGSAPIVAASGEQVIAGQTALFSSPTPVAPRGAGATPGSVGVNGGARTALDSGKGSV
jgi:hypothetical protein